MGILLTSVLVPSEALGISSWARKYSVDCATCHSPAVPRLNAFGHQFRKTGYRMDTEIKEGKPGAYKELGDFASVRFRTGYRLETFSQNQPGDDGFNKFRTRNGFVVPDVTLFYAGPLTKNLSLFTEIEFADIDETEVQVFGEWFSGNPEHFLTFRLGQMHTLSRVGWGGFDRPTGITTPDALNARNLTTSPVPFRIGEDQRGADVAYNFTPESRAILGVYNGVNQTGAGNEFAGNGSGDIDNAKDVLAAFEQMFGESGFTVFGYYGTWDEKAGPVDASGARTTGPAVATLPDNNDFTEYAFLRLGATGSWVFNVFDPKKVGASELQAGYFFARDFYPDKFNTLSLALPQEDSRDGHAFWAGVEQRLPHNAAVFYRYDQVTRSHQGLRGANRRHTVGGVYTIQEYLRLSLEGFIFDQRSDSFGALFQAMLNY